MSSNFDFLKTTDRKLFEMIETAEQLYRDEYFDQCIVQIRKFAENICKKILGGQRTKEKTFDDMLATLCDKSTGSEQEKEVIEDLYFIKKECTRLRCRKSSRASGFSERTCSLLYEICS